MKVLDRIRNAWRPSTNGEHKHDFDALENPGRRKSRDRRVYYEDSLLRGFRRDELLGSSQDLARNFALVSWAVRRHLDYVTAFTFRAKTGSDELDGEIENLVARQSMPRNCHLSRRHPLRNIIRFAEARAIVDGDVGLEKIAGITNRGRLNTIEGDRIRDERPGGTGRRQDRDAWVHGVKLDRYGAATNYGISVRQRGGGYIHEKVVPAVNFYLHAYWDSNQRFDSVRGVSPLSSAMNSFADVYEGFEYSLARIKVAQMFGLAVTTGSPDNPSYSEPELDEDGNPIKRYDPIDARKGPFFTELYPGDELKFLDAKTPAIETATFFQHMIMLSLKSIGIPYSFYDESHTNFFGSRGALLHYQRSTANRIADLQALLNWITRWWLGLWVFDGVLTLPAGMEFDDLVFEWVPRGVPWWDPSKEVAGAVQSIEAGLDNPQNICRLNGTDFRDNIDAIAEANAYAAERGVVLSYSTTDGSTDDDEDNRENDDLGETD